MTNNTKEKWQLFNKEEKRMNHKYEKKNLNSNQGNAN